MTSFQEASLGEKAWQDVQSIVELMQETLSKTITDPGYKNYLRQLMIRAF